MSCSRVGENARRHTVAVFVIILCLTVLLTCGIVVVRKYYQYPEYTVAKCTVKEVIQNDTIGCTQCKSEHLEDKTPCNFSIPCFKVMVKVEDIGVNDSDVIQMYQDKTRAEHMESENCSFSACRSSQLESESLVNQLADTYTNKERKEFACYLETRNQTLTVIPMHKPSLAEVIHSMLWPSIGICLAVIFIIIKLRHNNGSLVSCFKPGATSSGDFSRLPRQSIEPSDVPRSAIDSTNQTDEKLTNSYSPALIRTPRNPCLKGDLIIYSLLPRQNNRSYFSSTKKPMASLELCKAKLGQLSKEASTYIPRISSDLCKIKFGSNPSLDRLPMYANSTSKKEKLIADDSPKEECRPNPDVWVETQQKNKNTSPLLLAHDDYGLDETLV